MDSPRCSSLMERRPLAPTKRSGFLPVLRNPQFRILWLAQTVSGMGSMLAMFALLSLGGFRFALSTGELGGMAALFFLTLALIFPIAELSLMGRIRVA